MIRVGIVGYGYWGPNLARAAADSGIAAVGSIADLSPTALERASRRHPSARLLTDWRDLVADHEIDAVMVATPVHSHYEMALAALRAGKHVLVEKPMTDQVATSSRLIEEAARRKLTLMVDHTFVYTSAVRKIAGIIESGEIGDIYYLQLNAGKSRPIPARCERDLGSRGARLLGHGLPAADPARSPFRPAARASCPAAREHGASRIFYAPAPSPISTSTGWRR